ncbi:hypothetical protein K432DRAFT_390262 [Lepidopterella palustris CBS 459.81]|uniref:Uncharacterized protein n=1 Tax=Lepidopterella palustris CBS 459.81 TaxID=1314670 RepID=A0A8E2JIR6_9PEZI|nr:hypothetical protein K432DRAFT_390262 [Lepidopterella palustris CBS 459.81]
MTTPLSTHSPALEKALNEFRSGLSQDDQDEFNNTTLEDHQRSILEVQEKHASARKAKNMTRLKAFLEAMEQYGKIVEVFLNASNVLAFVWGPAKVSLTAFRSHLPTPRHLTSFWTCTTILGKASMFAQYESLFQDTKFGHMRQVLELLYMGVLRFHHAAYKYFTQRNDLRRHKNLVEKQAGLYQFEEIQRIRVSAEADFRRLWEAEDLKQRSAVQDWLLPANVEEDQEMKASVPAEYPGVCNWILDHRKFQAWYDKSSQSNPLLWITGIPGTENLHETPSAHVLFFYCKYGDKFRYSFVALARALIGQIVSQNKVAPLLRLRRSINKWRKTTEHSEALSEDSRNGSREFKQCLHHH